MKSLRHLIIRWWVSTIWRPATIRTTLSVWGKMYDTAFTPKTVNISNEVVVEEVEETGLPGLCCMILIVAAGTGIAWTKMSKSLKREPMQLLAERQEE